MIHHPGRDVDGVFCEPRPDQVCEETGEGLILIKDRQSGEVIGFERLYYKAIPGPNTVTVETYCQESRDDMTLTAETLKQRLNTLAEEESRSSDWSGTEWAESGLKGLNTCSFNWQTTTRSVRLESRRPLGANGCETLFGEIQSNTICCAESEWGRRETRVRFEKKLLTINAANAVNCTADLGDRYEAEKAVAVTVYREGPLGCLGSSVIS